MSTLGTVAAGGRGPASCRVTALALVLAALLPGAPAWANVLSGISDVQLESNQDLAEMGTSLAAADFDGDGLDDLLVGVHRHDDGEADEGGALLFLAPILSSSPFSAAARFQSDQAGALMGTSVAAGDVNGDGRADVLVGAPGYGTGGAVFVFLGGAAGVPSGTPATADLVFQSDRPNALFGTGIALGDFDGDGFDDILIGAPEYTNTQSFDTEREGVAVIFRGGPGIVSGTPLTAATLLAGGQRAADFGEFVGAGNVNGDGADDAIVSATRFDTNPTDAGAVFVFHGASPGGIPDGGPNTADTAILGDQFRGEIGSSLLATDLGGDGFDELLIGAHLYDNPDANEGVVLLYPGAAAGLPNGGPA
ncbi:MAG TPA: integrin alpha, partial [Thermoanaerobaculia bacterium]